MTGNQSPDQGSDDLTFEQMLADRHEQFDLAGQVLASIVECRVAEPAAATATPGTHPRAARIPPDGGHTIDVGPVIVGPTLERDTPAGIDLPPGLTILGLYLDFTRNAITIKVEGDHLRPVVPGCELPTLLDEAGQPWRPPPVDAYRQGYLDAYQEIDGILAKKATGIDP